MTLQRSARWLGLAHNFLEAREQVKRDREDDGGAFVGGHFPRGLQVAQLQSAGLGGQNLRGLREFR